MKSSYLLSFLLFLLLLDQPVSAANLPKLTQLKKWIKTGIKYTERFIDGVDFLDKISNTFNLTKYLSPPQEERSGSVSPGQIEGLSVIKDYFSNYGYILSSGPFNDSFDKETVSAIRTYQKYFNLQVTGKLNNETLNQMSFLRCGVPDINIDYNFTEDNSSWPKAGNRWFPKGKKITYGFLPMSEIPANATKVFKDSFRRWAQAAGNLNLTETKAYDNADIKIGFYNFTLLDTDEEMYGSSVILLDPDSGNKTATILLDGTKLWELPSENQRLSWEYGILDLESAAMHQIGHLLGLDHSNDTDSVMYPYILPSPQRKVKLSNSDKDNIHNQFANVNTGHRGGSGLLLVTTFSLGFAYVFLLY